MAFDSSHELLLVGGWAFMRTPTSLVRISLARSRFPNFMRPCSTLAIICGTGTFRGAGAKFIPLSNIDFCADVNGVAINISTGINFAPAPRKVPVPPMVLCIYSFCFLNFIYLFIYLFY